MKVMTGEECEARRSILWDHYVGTVEMEALCMIDMINQHIIPSVKEAEVGPLADLETAVGTLKAAIADIHAEEDEYTKADKARNLRLETMVSIRDTCDAAEAVVPSMLWTLPTYVELMFLDQTTK